MLQSHVEDLEILFSEFSILEALWLVIKQWKQKSTITMDIERRFFIGLQSLFQDYTLVHVNATVLGLTWNLYKKGHPDLIDCLLMAIASNEKAMLLTVDKTFFKFIESNARELLQWILMPNRWQVTT